MEKGRVGIASTVERSERSAEEVLEWLRSPDAATLARKRLAIAGFAGSESLVDDVLADAAINVIQRGRSSTRFELDNPAAYGTRVVQNVVKHLVRGDVTRLEDIEDPRGETPSTFDSGLADDLRILLEQSSAAPWLDSAVLAYVCLVMFPESVPPDAPAPLAGARPDQALVWPALWFAGERELFPCEGADPHKRTRARRIAKVQEHLAHLGARHRAELGADDG